MSEDIDEGKVFEMAKRLYRLHSGNDPHIHCNRLPSWDELTPERRKQWWTVAHHMVSEGYRKPTT